jgi:hypothetical protein
LLASFSTSIPPPSPFSLRFKPELIPTQTLPFKLLLIVVISGVILGIINSNFHLLQPSWSCKEKEPMSFRTVVPLQSSSGVGKQANNRNAA